MPSSQFKRVNLDLIYLPFFAVASEVIARCSAKGGVYFATYGLRTFEEQAQLRANYLAGKGGKAAPAGLSAHQYGIAFDFCRDADGDASNGLQPSWRGPEYALLGSEARAAGLIWGQSFGDAPHIQWPGYVSGPQLADLRDLHRAKGQAAVWARLDAERAVPAWRARNPRLAAELARLGF